MVIENMFVIPSLDPNIVILHGLIYIPVRTLYRNFASYIIQSKVYSLLQLVSIATSVIWFSLHAHLAMS